MYRGEQQAFPNTNHKLKNEQHKQSSYKEQTGDELKEHRKEVYPKQKEDVKKKQGSTHSLFRAKEKQDRRRTGRGRGRTDRDRE